MTCITLGAQHQIQPIRAAFYTSIYDASTRHASNFMEEGEKQMSGTIPVGVLSTENKLMLRQGDVLLRSVAAIPDPARNYGRGGESIVNSGNFRGHDHYIPHGATMHFDQDASGESHVFVCIEIDGAALMHAEHAAILVPRGKYEVIRQREYHPEGNRHVAD